MAWTKFYCIWGMLGRRLPYNVILIALPKEEAIAAFRRIFDCDPLGPFDDNSVIFISSGQAPGLGLSFYQDGTPYYPTNDRTRLRIIPTAELAQLLMPPKRSRVVTLLEEEPA